MSDSSTSRIAKTSPLWWRVPQQQLATARLRWPDAVLPKPPVNFSRRTETEVLLLHVPDTFDNLWDKVTLLEPGRKFRWEGAKSDKFSLQIAPNTVVYTDPVWLAFDPQHGMGEAPDALWGQSDLAGPEVFSALIQFPYWPHTWFLGGQPAPNLTGYQVKYNGRWSRTPYLSWSASEHRLDLDAVWAGHPDHRWSSPSVRKC